MSSIECPVGAVSSTTKALRPSLTMRENAWNTATSSVQGGLQVLQQQRLLLRVEVGRLGGHDLVDVALCLDLRVDAADLEARQVAFERAVQVCRGSVVLRCTVLPRCTRPMANAAAIVVLPTPPLPITMIKP